MYISLTLPKLSTEYLRFFKQIGVNHVDLYPSILPSYRREHIFKTEEVKAVIRKVREEGLEVAIFVAPTIRNFLLGKKSGKAEIERLKSFVKVVAREHVPLVHICIGCTEEGLRKGPAGVPGYYDIVHKERGGYVSRAFSVKLMEEELEKACVNTPWKHHFEETLSFETFWTRCIEAYEEVIPIAEEYDIRLCTHFDDPPVNHPKLLPGITSFRQIRDFLEEIKSRHVGILFCCGTRYESGENLYEQLEYFSNQGKIFHVHLRNVKGTIPSGGFIETFLDDGDIDIIKVLKILKTAKYDKAINPDHFPKLIGDPEGYASRAWAVGYLKGILSSL